MNKRILLYFLLLLFLIFFSFYLFPGFFSGNIAYIPKQNEIKNQSVDATVQAQIIQKPLPVLIPPLDTALYDKMLNELANNPIPKGPITKIIKDPKTGKQTTVIVSPKPTPPNQWPVKTVYPNAGAILPFSRIVAYYGNLYSTKMGVLGEYPETEMFQRLEVEVKKWAVADPSTPVIPALHYIAVVAQGSPGASGMYRARMPDSEIDKIITMAAKINAIVFLDVQVGLSNVQTEVPLLEKYLKMPNVHLALDPEFSMKTGAHPGKVVGTMDATDINFASNYLANLVRENNLPPKILIVHRYTEKMVTNYKNIKTMPEVQIVMNMDGWGAPAQKIGTYNNFIYPEPVQFTGFKLFYKNDVSSPGTVMLTPAELLKLTPRPIYIQYQ